MSIHRKPEWVGGATLTLLGVSVVIYTLQNYPLGTFRQIGPGFLPVTLGGLLTFMGLLIAWMAHPFDPNGEHKMPMGNAMAITLSVLAFALLIERAGYVPAIIATVAIATLPWRDGSWALRLLIGVLTAVFVWLVFQVGLTMQIHAFAF